MQAFERKCDMGLSAGLCSQASFLAPLVWWLVDSWPSGSMRWDIAFTDKAMVIIGAKNRKVIIKKGKAVTAVLVAWARSLRIIFSATKCHLMLLKDILSTASIKITLSGICAIPGSYPAAPLSEQAGPRTHGVSYHKSCCPDKKASATHNARVGTEAMADGFHLSWSICYHHLLNYQLLFYWFLQQEN